MNASTAQGRLLKDILYSLVVQTGQDDCFRCGKKITRDTFSIEHKEAWLDSEDPIKNFFDLGNIAYSHKTCNYSAARKVTAKCGKLAAYARGCRCGPCKEAQASYKRERYTPENRRIQYERSGN